MTTHTTLLTFEAPSLDLTCAGARQSVTSVFMKNLLEHGFEIGYNYEQSDFSMKQNQILVSFISYDGSDAVLRGHRGGLITLDIHEFVDHHKGSKSRFTDQIVGQIETKIKTALECCYSKRFPAVRRGEKLDVYYPTVDHRFLEYDFQRVVYHSKSQYQDILIVESETFGNVLILDGDINMGESDVIYSHTLMQKGSLDYTGKTCLVLGGGDGGLLNELLKEKPQMVTLVDIDEAVLTAARIHLRGVCGSSLDSFKGENYEVIVGDALELLQNYVTKGHQFDFVLYDLTSIPITPEEEDYDGEFCKATHSLALKVLAPGGYYLAQANALMAKRSIELFEGLLRTSEIPVKWKRHQTFVPSYGEAWVFFQIWKQCDAQNSA